MKAFSNLVSELPENSNSKKQKNVGDIRVKSYTEICYYILSFDLSVKRYIWKDIKTIC
jgi:hypothetical protein